MSTVPAPASPVCSPGGSKVAYVAFAGPGRGLFVGDDRSYRKYEIAELPTAMTFSPDGLMLYCLTAASNGEGALVRVQLHTGEVRTIASRLDLAALGLGGPISISADGKLGYLALASDGVPNNELRHKPSSDRWLKIYAIDLVSGARRRVVDSPGRDNTAPAVVNGSLYWIRTVLRDSIVSLPVGGGEVREIIAGGELPIWHPNGSLIGYYFGDNRLSDFPLDLDAAAVGVDARGNRKSDPQVIVSGYHEDFSPAWSPDGRWIAFHSHRSRSPVPSYVSPGSTDDVYLRRAADPTAPEIRLTDFGRETGPAFWSPDGRKLLFVSNVQAGSSSVGKLWVTTVDTLKGAAVKSETLPLSNEIHSVRWAAWSPDGKEIVIEDDRGADKRVMWVVRADGLNPEKLLDYQGTTYGGLDWMRDGKTIVFSGLAEGRLQLYSISRSGGPARLLTHDSGNLLHPRVSPDGLRIACTRIVQSKQIWRRPI